MWIVWPALLQSCIIWLGKLGHKTSYKNMHVPSDRYTKLNIHTVVYSAYCKTLEYLIANVKLNKLQPTFTTTWHLVGEYEGNDIKTIMAESWSMMLTIVYLLSFSHWKTSGMRLVHNVGYDYNSTVSYGGKRQQQQQQRGVECRLAWRQTFYSRHATLIDVREQTVVERA